MKDLENYDQNLRFSMKVPYCSKNVSKGSISQLWFIVNLMQFDASCSSSMNRNSSSKNHSFHQLSIWLLVTCGFAVFHPASMCWVARSGLHLGSVGMTEVLAEIRNFSLSCWLKWTSHDTALIWFLARSEWHRAEMKLKHEANVQTPRIKIKAPWKYSAFLASRFLEIGLILFNSMSKDWTVLAFNVFFQVGDSWQHDLEGEIGITVGFR